jgi:hypothetical protein
MSDAGPKPWTIRNVTQEARDTAISAAKSADVDLGAWVSHAIRQTALSDRGGMAGEVVSDRVSDNGADSRETVAMLFAGLGQIAGVKGCGGLAERTRALIEQHLDRMALAPLPGRRAPPKRLGAP